MTDEEPSRQNKQSDKLCGLAITKNDDKYEIAVKFCDGSSFVFDCEFKADNCTATVGVGDTKGVGKFN
jgi:hypothetical protein